MVGVVRHCVALLALASASVALARAADVPGTVVVHRSAGTLVFTNRVLTFSEDERLSWGAFRNRLGKALEASWRGDATRQVSLVVQLARPGEVLGEVRGKPLDVTSREFLEPGRSVPWARLGLDAKEVLVRERVATRPEQELGDGGAVASVLQRHGLVREQDVVVVVRGVLEGEGSAEVAPLVYVVEPMNAS